MFHDLYFVSSDVEINFSLGQKQTVLNVLLAGTINSNISDKDFSAVKTPGNKIK